MIVYELNTPAGSGKTRACARHADRLARGGEQVLFVQPTKHLITSTIAEELQPLAPTYPVRAIHSDACLKASVVAEAVFGSIYDRLPLDHVDHEDDDSFIAGLRALHQRVVERPTVN